MFKKSLLSLSIFASIGTLALLNPVAIFGESQIPKNQENKIELHTIPQLPKPESLSIAKAITVQVHVGEYRGSGILIAKNNNTYTVITNAHVVDRGNTYHIETSDSIKHRANLISKDGSTTGNDLALLEFQSNNKYQIAKIGDSNKLALGENIIAAGFPFDADKLHITTGKISLLPDKSLEGGYQIGFTNQTRQGMSGGVLLNSNGEVIGVLGKGKDAIFDTAYTYIDGTNPTPEELTKLKNASFSIPIANITDLSPNLASILPQQKPETPTLPKEYTGIVGKIDKIAEQITVRIATTKTPSHGSGVIIARNGNTYYVATAKHVVKNRKEYQIVTPDGEKYNLDNQTIEQSDAYDFAIFSFTSNQDYTVATLGNYTVAANNKQVLFVSGFPENQSPKRIITAGKVFEKNETKFKTKDTHSLVDSGQGLLYSNLSYKGISGGAVLDREGRVVGINTGAEHELLNDDEGNYEEFSLGFSIGISTPDILGFLNKTQLKTRWLKQSNNLPMEVNDNEYSQIQTQLLTVKKPDNNNDLVAWMNYGNKLWRYEKHDEAIAAFERVIAIEPQFHQAYYAMSLAYWSQKEYNKAITVLNKATEINPNPYHYWRYLGFFYGQIEEFDLALFAYNQAISKNPKDFVLYQEYADVLDDDKQYNKAILFYNKALEINPNHPWIYNNRGTTYYRSQQYDKAIKDFETVIKLNPQDPEAHNNLAISYSDLEQYEKAISYYNKAIEFDPNYALAYGNRGATYNDLGKYDEALADYNIALKLDPEEALTYFNLAITYRKLEQYDKALGYNNRAIELDRNFVAAYHSRGSIYDDLRQYDKALDDYNRAIQLDPKYAKTYINRGIIYAALQQNEKALADYNQAIEINPNFAEVYSNRGILYFNLGESSKALEDFNRAISLDAQYDIVYYNRGTLYNILEQYDRALLDFNQALKLNPQYIEAYINRGNAYKQLEQYSQALADFNQAIELNPELEEGYLKRSGIYQDLKEYDKAIADLEQLIKINPENPQYRIFIALVYYKLKDIPKTKQYFAQAAEIYKQQNNTEEYQKIQKLLEVFPQS